MEVHGHTVRGVDVGPETRCRHYDSELDVIAIRFPCCGTFYPCYECHLAAADHEPQRWGDEGSMASGGVEDAGSTDRTGVEDAGSTDRTGVEDAGSTASRAVEDQGATGQSEADSSPARANSGEGGSTTGTDAEAGAVLCGICGSVLTVSAYVDCDDRCPDCGAAFNPGCRRHYDRYFAEELFEKEN